MFEYSIFITLPSQHTHPPPHTSHTHPHTSSLMQQTQNQGNRGGEEGAGQGFVMDLYFFCFHAVSTNLMVSLQSWAFAMPTYLANQASSTTRLTFLHLQLPLPRTLLPSTELPPACLTAMTSQRNSSATPCSPCVTPPPPHHAHFLCAARCVGPSQKDTAVICSMPATALTSSP